ncbi:putative baseplate assembly protein [Natronobiforma cellulositropha]|uniref:putative baseplate assembly protein n=1 Tax=Natronobiforma cellulositropha TaxID=1679076 RepID=UPI0021D612F7|nr:putative baseplate assembly protein [Natronobiforma cellulositropha]
MGLDVPDLDDREFEDVFEETKRRIPIYTESWSDHNAHDTGIAILELLAWISETYTYQLDRVTEEHREKYLHILGVDRQPPRPATARVSVRPPEGGDGLVVPAGEALLVDDRSGVSKTFETTTDATLTEARLEKVITHAGGDTVDNTTENETENTYFVVFGEEPRAGDAIYFGFDRDPLGAADELALTVEFYERNLPAPAEHGDAESTFEPSVELVWECCHEPDRWRDDDAWSRLEVAADGTDAFYHGGVVRLERTAETPTPASGGSVLGQPDELVWLRCRLAHAEYEIPPQCSSIRVNVLEAAHRSTVHDEFLTRSDDGLETTIDAERRFFFEHGPVLEADIVVDGERFEEVEDFDTSGPTDRHYVFDAERRSIRFGDGVRGAKPPVGRRVRAKRYVYGGGQDGNVSVHSQWEFEREDAELADGISPSDLAVEPTGPASGGADAESVEEAMDRFKRDLKRPYRAVTLEDYSYVATHTPGLRFGRANATRREFRRDDTDRTEIVLSVVPYSTHARPEASEAFLDAVRKHVERNRLLTDAVRVEAPHYVDLEVDLTVSATPERPPRRLRGAIREALTAYVHPLTGFDGEGWPFGRPLYVSEVENVVGDVDGVRGVLDVTVTASGEEEIDDHGNVIIPETSLLSLLERSVSVSVRSSSAHVEGAR